MKNNITEEFDIVVIGGGHAGCEAALASARLGSKTLMLVTDIDSVAMMPCNPAIGGTGKGHLVREIDALGGEMGVNIDKTFIQSRMLNTAKGPAVHSLRAQADKEWYHQEMLKTIENQPNLTLHEEEAIDLLLDEEKKGREGESFVRGVVTSASTYSAKAVVIATGTFLRGKIFIGENVKESGPGGMAPAKPLAENLEKYGLPLRRFKTGTPARALARSFDYDKMQEQKGDSNIVPFSFMNEKLEREQISCWLTYTNHKTHEIIKQNFHRSALFGGQIEGIGPRYCPSIEDKVNRFSDKERHQLFIEPEGLSSDEMYIQGMSSSLPEDVQHEFYHSIEGLENIEITKPAYAIEYDCVDPLSLKPSLESKIIKGLFCAGQFNGSSGYEEAAAQGIIAGINANMLINGKEPLVLGRNEAYIGVLIDDLVTKGTNEPYRIMTSRAEYRLLLRQDNADGRLTEKAYKIGLASEERYQLFLKKREEVERERKRLEETMVKPAVANPFLASVGSAEVAGSISLTELLKRPEVSYENLAAIDKARPTLSHHATAQIAVEIKYSGYIDKQRDQVERFKKLEDRRLPADLDYLNMKGLRIEAAQKLDAQRPESLGRASRISGVSPADINVLLVYLEKERRKK
ncbi:MAG: tRNA uridine-5-carboxymethylaminomethyl(34) synthesis enzyme MnmG [Firmicutes bacterium]|nr:tRNA uridine-5-carboxymethylaminomethyl(34) synthesis enzyme MnmG [Bacillota bacterium]